VRKDTFRFFLTDEQALRKISPLLGNSVRKKVYLGSGKSIKYTCPLFSTSYALDYEVNFTNYK